MSQKAAIYLDSNAGVPLHPKVREALSELGSLVPNPSSIHAPGREAKRMLAQARERVARSLGPKTDPEQLIFTSSGSESNQLAIRSVLEPLLDRGEKPHWILTPVEHDSTLQMVEWLESRGGSVSYLTVDSDGRPEAAVLRELWRSGETALVSAVWVNNETGVITDVAALSRAVSELGGTLHLDGAQAWGKLEIDVEASGAQLVSFSAHKIGAFAGSGALWLRRGTRAQALVRGKQEKGRRGGTENVIGIHSMGVAAAELRPAEWAAKLAPLRDRLQNAICSRIPGTLVNGGNAPRAANTLSLSFEQVEGDGLVMALDLAGYAVSSGSACSSGALEPSHVLLAMGRTKAQAIAAIRISLPSELEWQVLEGFVGALERVVGRVRQAAPGALRGSVKPAEDSEKSERIG